ncbi:MAG: mobile mystery protein A [Desulfobulbaceae bacterium]|nr:mobile mystery protein A [Desulfobulbaceae bacterium]
MDKRKLSREQLDASLLRFNPLLNTTLPSRGWIKALRYAIGMSARQLADRLGVTQQRVDRIEKEELTGSLTIKTMQRVASSLDCVFVYGFVPRTNLEEIVRNRAREVAINRLNRVTHTMSL